MTIIASRWRTLIVTAIVAALMVPNVLLLRESFGVISANPSSYDWELIVEATRRIGTGTMYVWDTSRYTVDDYPYVYRYSPVLAHLMAPLVPYGLATWRLLHIVPLLALPRPVAVIALLMGPFWFDVAHGNFMTFIVVSAWLALTGNRWGMGAYFALTCLLPRPIMLPVAVWLLWRRPASRTIAAVVVVILGAATLATGEGLSWLVVLPVGIDVIGTDWDIGPSRLLGLWWWPIGLLASGWLLWRGRLGLASIAISPYWLPYYLLFLLLELRQQAESPAIERRDGGKSVPLRGRAALS